MSEIEPYDWCDACDVPVDAERHLDWHARGGRPRHERGRGNKPGYSREGARSVIRP